MSEQPLIATDVVEPVDETIRLLGICNACRYCEGYCPVFQTMTQHRTFAADTADYLANLCHNCMACYHACQYKPPHPFSVNVPSALAATRTATYEAFAWPGVFANLFKRNGLVVSTAIALGLAIVLGLTVLMNDSQVLLGTHTEPGAFYQIIPHAVMVAVAGTSFVGALLALTVSLLRFARHIGLRRRDLSRWRVWRQAISQVVTLEHLGGGHGDGCNTVDDAYSNRRRVFHHLTMWGFMLCFAATCVATVYEYFLNRLSPFPYFSLPVMLGSIGGLGLLIGCAGLFVVKLNTAREPLHIRGMGMDYAFINLLFWISLTGFALLFWRETQAMGLLLAIHLGFVLAFFVTLPYSKFVHGAYRGLALLKYAADSQGQATKGH
ncbi:MAG: tricarballylate utilization 4Fe-4S protein TcuB [Pseudomonadota bacterium]